MKLQHWQEQILEGVKAGEMKVIYTGRQTGKSLMSQYLNQWSDIFETLPAFEKLDAETVDGKPWYTVACRKDVSAWVRQQPKDQWYEHKQQARHQRGVFDMPESLFIIMSMKWV